MKLLLFTLAFLSISCKPLEINTVTPTGNFKNDFLSQINKIRARGCNCGNQYMPPVAPLTWNENLQLAAQRHATDMLNKRYFDHITPDGVGLKQRLERAGYTFTGFQRYGFAENIAAGQKSISQVMDGWIKSPGHCKNLMNGNYTEVGVAENGNYWVQDFGVRIPFKAKTAR